jgi:hypothetical protein
MKNSNEPRNRRFIILTVVFILLSIVMLFWARDVIREVVVLPLSYLLYLFGILIDYTPQIFFWIILLLIGLRIAYLSISRKKVKDEAELARFRRPIDDFPGSNGRVWFWTNKVHLLHEGRGVYYTSTFHQALSHTLFQLLAYRYRMTVPQVEEGVKNGSLALPQDIRDYALEFLTYGEKAKGRFWDFTWEKINSALRKAFTGLKLAVQAIAGGVRPGHQQTLRLDGRDHSDTSTQRMDSRESGIDAQVRRILKFMEEELEVPHDDTGL